jgi:tetratricopeptide (TPR) repeat protein
MEILIFQAGEQLGPLSEEKVREYLEQGIVSPSDLALSEGMENWQSLDSVMARFPVIEDKATEKVSSDTAPPDATLPELPPVDVEATQPDSPMSAVLPMVQEPHDAPAVVQPAPPTPESSLTENLTPEVSEASLKSFASPLSQPQPPISANAEPSTESLESSSSMTQKDVSETLDRPAAASSEEAELPLTASQKTKRNKIVIQPILPLEPATAVTPPVVAALKKKAATGKTMLTIEPLRPTTSLPPVSTFTPKDTKEKKTGKTLLRTNALSPASVPEKSVVAPKLVTTPPPTLTAAPVATFNTSRPALLPALSSSRQPFDWTALAQTTADWFEGIPAWFQRQPRQVAYAVIAALSLLFLSIFLCFGYLLLAEHKSTSAANLDTGPPPIKQEAMQLRPQDEPESVPANPTTAVAFNQRGISRQAKGDLDGAIEDFNQALNLDPQNVKALYQRGLANQAKGDNDSALADYSQVLGLDPKNADAFSNRGFVKQTKGDLDGAFADYSQALALNPKISAAYYNEGLIEVQKGNFDEAIDAYNHALDINPKMARAFYSRGMAKNAEGNLDGAIADFTQALTVDPTIARAYYDRAVTRQHKADVDGALSDYTQALTLDPKIADAFYNRGVIKAQKADLDGAISDTTQAIDLDAKNGPAFFCRGLARFGKGDLDGAMADLKEFCDLAPRNLGADTAHLYLWLIATEENPRGTADQDLSTTVLNDWNSPPEDLTSKLAAFLLGHIHENKLIADAASPDPARGPGQYCKVYYFAGMKRLLSGDMATAITYFQKSLSTNQNSLCEYTFSQSELKALGQNREVASKPESGL